MVAERFEPPHRGLRRLLRRCVLAALMVVLVGATPAGAGESADTSGQALLAVLHAGGGTFTTTDSGHRLTLDDIDRRAVWFTDRPARDAGSYSIDELDESFFAGTNPPNGALEVFSGKAAGDVLVLELSEPRYQKSKGRLILDVRVLADDEITTAGLNGLAARATDDVPSRFGPAALFLDATCTVETGVAQLVGTTCTTANDVVQALATDRCASDEATLQSAFDAGNAPSAHIGDALWFCYQDTNTADAATVFEYFGGDQPLQDPSFLLTVPNSG